MDSPFAILQRFCEIAATGQEHTSEDITAVPAALAVVRGEMIVAAHAARLDGNSVFADASEAGLAALAAGLPPSGVTAAVLATVASQIGWSELKFLAWGEALYTRLAGSVAGGDWFLSGCIENAHSDDPRFYPWASHERKG